MEDFFLNKYISDFLIETKKMPTKTNKHVNKILIDLKKK
jgi:hypothetical protein